MQISIRPNQNGFQSAFNFRTVNSSGIEILFYRFFPPPTLFLPARFHYWLQTTSRESRNLWESLTIKPPYNRWSRLASWQLRLCLIFNSHPSQLSTWIRLVRQNHFWAPSTNERLKPLLLRQAAIPAESKTSKSRKKTLQIFRVGRLLCAVGTFRKVGQVRCWLV